MTPGLDTGGQSACLELSFGTEAFEKALVSSCLQGPSLSTSKQAPWRWHAMFTGALTENLWLF